MARHSRKHISPPRPRMPGPIRLHSPIAVLSRTIARQCRMPASPARSLRVQPRIQLPNVGREHVSAPFLRRRCHDNHIIAPHAQHTDRLLRTSLNAQWPWHRPNCRIALMHSQLIQARLLCHLHRQRQFQFNGDQPAFGVPANEVDPGIRVRHLRPYREAQPLQPSRHRR